MPEYCGLLQIQPVDGIVTVEGRITTNANPILPGAGAANSNAWIGATNGAAGLELKWAQIGYLWRRLDTGEMQLNVYTEVQAGPNDDTDYFVQYFPAPAPGAHRYVAVLDEFAGIWTFFLDGQYLTAFQNDGWVGITARKTQFTCEINGIGARVLGTDETPCTFSDCRYEIASIDRRHPVIVTPNFNDGDVWRVLDEVQGGGGGAVTLDPLQGDRFDTSRDVDASLAQSLGAVDRRGRPQSPSSHVPAQALPAELGPAGEEALRDASSRLADHVARGELAELAIVLSGVDPERRCLLVAIETEAFRNPARFHRRLRDVLGEVRIRVVPGSLVEQNGGAGNLTGGTPLEGGIQISSKTGGGKSTLGVCAYCVQTKKLGFLAAGHTVGKKHELVGQPDDDHIAGLVAVNLYESSIDVAFVNVTSGVPANVLKVWTAKGSYTVTHVLSGNPGKDMDCSMQGAQSGAQTGKVSQYINITVYKAMHPIKGVTLATYASAAGDSGAPVVSFRTDAKVLLLGIHNGRIQMENKDYAYFTQYSTFQPFIELAAEPPIQ